jgi:hypothetical protein
MQVTPIAKIRARAGRRSRAFFVLWGTLGFAAVACVYDPDDACGPNQELYGDGVRCVCVDGAALTPSGCVMCGANEVAGATACECAPGYGRPASGGPCEVLATSGQGAVCDDATPCLDPVASHCEPDGAGSGYCTTTDCTAAPCSGDYACDESTSPSVCLRPPRGQSMSCTSDADCAGTEATFCDTVKSHSCLVRGCAVGGSDCFIGWACCDLTSLGLAETICVPEGACPT